MKVGPLCLCGFEMLLGLVSFGFYFRIYNRGPLKYLKDALVVDLILVLSLLWQCLAPD